MHLKRFGGLWLACCFTTALFAAWSNWSPMVPDQHQDGREDLVQIRIAAGDNLGSSRTSFQYELHNRSRDQSARIIVHFPELDPATGRWEDPTEPKVIVLRPNGRYAGSTFSQESSRLRYAAKIIWDHEPGFGESQPTDSDMDPMNPVPPGSTVDEEPDQQSDIEEGNSALPPELLDGNDPVSIELLIIKGADTPLSDSEWVQEVVFYINDFSAAPKSGEPSNAYGRVLEINGTQIRAFIHGIHFSEIRAWMHLSANKFRVLKVTSLSGASLLPEVKNPLPNVRPSTPNPLDERQPPTKQVRPGKMDTVSAGATHEGYWYDPSDKEADESAFNPVMYVRFLGKARRVLLSEAQSVYGVPNTANVRNMTHYEERRKAIIINRGTHRAPKRADQGGR